MCGIAGTIGQDLVPSNLPTLRMLAAMQHRGPDETKVSTLGTASIGACRLGIVDGEHGSQPVLTSCHGRPQVVALNGEIYNYRELRGELGAEHRLHSHSDTEVLGHLLESEGPTCLARLNGMFAIAVTDGRTTRLIRDRLGVKPLYYRVRSGTLAFASEARALAEGPTLPLLEPTYPEFETTVGTETPFPGVLELPPGCYLEHDAETGRHRFIRYYNLPIALAEELTEDEAAEQLRWLVSDAVRIRTATTLPYGCYVSGGVDSTLVAQLAEPQWLVSAVVTDRAYMDEQRYVNVVRSAVPAQYREVRLRSSDLLDTFVDMVRVLDFPTTNLSAFTQYVLAREVNGLGVRVMLNGIGVDEILAGYTRHVAAAYAGDLAALAEQFPSYRPLLAKLAGTPETDLAERYYRLVNRDGGGSIQGRAVVRRAMAAQPSALRKLAATDLAVSFPPLLRCDDRVNMRFSVESRSPFLDYRVVDFLIRLPDALRLRRDAAGTVHTKYLLRRAFADVLPPAIAQRTDKVGFPSPVAIWLREQFSDALRQARRAVADVPELAKWYADTDLDEFSRSGWQLLQWGAWCLLNVHGMSVDEASDELFRAARRTSVAV